MVKMAPSKTNLSTNIRKCRETPPKSIIEDVVLAKKSEKKMERGWLVPIEQVPPNLKTGNIHQNCNRKIDNHVVLAKKRCKEDRERMVCSLRASPTYFEYWKNPPKSKINDIV